MYVLHTKIELCILSHNCVAPPLRNSLIAPLIISSLDIIDWQVYIVTVVLATITMILQILHDVFGLNQMKMEDKVD